MSERTGAHQQLAPRDFSIVFHGVGKRLSLNDSSGQTRAAEPRESAFLRWACRVWTAKRQKAETSQR